MADQQRQRRFEILSAARVLELVRRIDHGAPVTVVQHQLANLRKWRVSVEAPIDALGGSFVWIFATVMAMASYGFDPWSAWGGGRSSPVWPAHGRHGHMAGTPARLRPQVAKPCCGKQRAGGEGGAG
ncbi:MAG TPA: hypothetical protein VFK29_03295 [Rhodanobacteraceae bacterium]|nr:hypothetical protein [Rhodanobacteraceae bacterium]